ncbi:MAG: SDR family NAD(P)-dependent oxidoreductase [Nannocystaceae bacterium]
MTGSSTSTRPLALVTGASRGIGRAIAERLADEHDLVLHARSAASLDALASALRGRAEVSIVAGDLGDEAGLQGVLAGLAALPRPILVLINNAGMAASRPALKTEPALWRSLLDVNLRAPFELARALLPGMIAAGFGRVINVASTAALKGYAYTAAYSASKAGLVGWTRALAVEVARSGVTVNAVCPGFTDTDIAADAVKNIARATRRSPEEARGSLAAFSPQGRLLGPEEVAGLVAYLASPAAGGVNGQALAIDGGETA